MRLVNLKTVVVISMVRKPIVIVCIYLLYELHSKLS
jgi:hypothetical protein